MAPGLRKLVDIGPGGVIYPGSAQDLRYADNAGHLEATGTRWLRMWADWPSLQPDGAFAPDDPASPGHWRLQALDEQIALACSMGIAVMLVPYRFPPWANGTAALAAQRNTDAEVSFAYGDRMTQAAWDRYVRNGRDPAVYNPSRRTLEFRLGEDPYGPSSAWAGFFAFLHDRYTGDPGRQVAAFDLVNEPNLQLWPQMAPPAGADPFAPAPRTVEAAIARMLATAQEVSAARGHAALLLAPSVADSDNPTSRLYTRFDEFAGGLLGALDAIGYAAHDGQAWSHHDYIDIETRQGAARLQRVREQLIGRWSGRGGPESPSVFLTEGGARLVKMRSLYPGEDPLAAQAECLRRAWDAHLDAPGVEMLAQYLLHSDPNSDSGLLDPYPSTAKRPAYETWRGLPASE